MTIPLYVANAFDSGPFTGNPAAVCLLEEWPADGTMQNIATQNNLSETAFVVRHDDVYHIRWFTPAAEIMLAGHPTLAAAHIILNETNSGGDAVVFLSPSGKLAVTRRGEEYILDLPSDKSVKVLLPSELQGAFSTAPVDCYKGKFDYMLVFQTQQDIEEAKPNLALIEKADCRGVIITAPGDEVDFVSRFFAPQLGISEDPVTGSAHTVLIPYWWERYGKIKMNAVQLSVRKGFLTCAYLGERVELGGRCSTYLKGEIYI